LLFDLDFEADSGFFSISGSLAPSVSSYVIKLKRVSKRPRWKTNFESFRFIWTFVHGATSGWSLLFEIINWN